MNKENTKEDKETIKYYIDDTLFPLEIIKILKEKGIDVKVVTEDECKEYGKLQSMFVYYGVAAEYQYLLIERATNLDRTLLSCDENILAEAVKKQRDSVYFPGLILVALSFRYPNSKCIEDLELIAKTSNKQDLASFITRLPFP